MGWECWVRTGWGARAVRGHASRLTCLSIALNLHVRCDSACPQLCRARARACQVRPGPVSRRATAQGCPPRVLCAPSSPSARVVDRARPHTFSRWCRVPGAPRVRWIRCTVHAVRVCTVLCAHPTTREHVSRVCALVHRCVRGREHPRPYGLDRLKAAMGRGAARRRWRCRVLRHT